MVNFGLNSASILGIFLAVAGASLYFLRSVRPELSRDHDIFFAAVGLLCGFILLFQGWRLDPILQFGQFLLTGSTIFFAVESIRLRKVATEQARRNTPTVDRERPVSRTRVYREEEYDRRGDRTIPESYNAYEGATPNYDSPRLRGYEDPKPRSSRPRSLREEEPRNRSYRSREDRYSTSEPPRTRRPANNPPRRNGYDDRNSYDEWSREDSWDEPDYPNNNYSERRDLGREQTTRDRYERERPYSDDIPRRSSRKPPSNPVERPRNYSNDDLGRNYDDGLGRSYEDDLGDSYEDDSEVIATDYVDYQPLDDLGSSYDEESDYDDRGDLNEAEALRDRENSRPRRSSSDWDEPRNRNNPPNSDY